jgi:predicted ester cyclase
MTTDQNTATVRAIEAAWDSNALDALDAHFAPTFNNRQSATPGLPGGLAGAKLSHQGVMAAFPDRKVEVLDTVAQGDRVFVRMRVTGTNTGGAAFLGQPDANGAKIDFEMWGLYRLEDGRVVEHWGLNDGITAMMQVGAMPSPM